MLYFVCGQSQPKSPVSEELRLMNLSEFSNQIRPSKLKVSIFPSIAGEILDLKLGLTTAVSCRVRSLCLTLLSTFEEGEVEKHF